MEAEREIQDVREGEREEMEDWTNRHNEGNYEQTGGAVSISVRSFNAPPPVLVSRILFAFSSFSSASLLLLFTSFSHVDPPG